MPLASTHRAACLAPLMAACLARSALAGPEPEGCRASALREDRLIGMAPRGELVLASGARAVLSGLHWPEAEPDAAAAQAWLLRFRDRPLTLGSRGEEDRWGRARVDALADPLDESDAPADLAAGLIAAGLAAVDAGESDALCRPDLLPLEAAARADALGLWRHDPVRDARDGAALAGLAGRFVVARGRVLAVGERPGRTYLDFVRRGEAGLTVTVPKRTWRILQERGLTAQTLRGRWARVRGRVEMRRGPVLDLVSPDMIEVEDPGSGDAERKGEAARTR